MNEADAGLKPAELCREYGISEHTLYRWKDKYGDMAVSDVKKMRQIEEENSQRRKLITQQELDTQGLKTVVGLARKKEAAKIIQEEGLFERLAAVLLIISGTALRYGNKPQGMLDERSRLIELALKHRRFSYRKLGILLR